MTTGEIILLFLFALSIGMMLGAADKGHKVGVGFLGLAICFTVVIIAITRIFA